MKIHLKEMVFEGEEREDDEDDDVDMLMIRTVLS